MSKVNVAQCPVKKRLCELNGKQKLSDAELREMLALILKKLGVS